MKKLTSLLLCAGAATVGVATIAMLGGEQLSRTMWANDYSGCASIHFGMNDNDRSAMTYEVATSFSADAAIMHNINATFTSTKVYSKNYQDGEEHKNYAIKFSAKGAAGELNITLDKDVVGATIYAAAYKTDKAAFTCNNVRITPTTSITVEAGEANAKLCTYLPYTVAFARTNKIKIVAAQASQCRFM